MRVLTNKEVLLAQMCSEGLTYRQIAASMGCTYDQVLQISKSLRAKAKAKNITHTVKILLKAGLIS